MYLLIYLAKLEYSALLPFFLDSQQDCVSLSVRHLRYNFQFANLQNIFYFPNRLHK